MKIQLLKEFVELLRNRFSNYYPNIKLNKSKDEIIIDDNKNYTILTRPHGTIWIYQIRLKSPCKEKARELENMYDWKLFKDIIKDLKSRKIKYKICKDDNNAWCDKQVDLLELNLTLGTNSRFDNGSPVIVTYLRSEEDIYHFKEVMNYLNNVHRENLNIGKYKWTECK